MRVVVLIAATTAAAVVVDCAAPARGEDVVDVGCGTGNAALLAAELAAAFAARWVASIIGLAIGAVPPGSGRGLRPPG